MTAEDIAVELIRKALPPGVDVFCERDLDVQQKLQGVLVVQRPNPPADDLPSCRSYAQYDVECMGPNGGIAGERTAYQWARAIYRWALSLPSDIEVQGERVGLVRPDARPYKVGARVAGPGGTGQWIYNWRLGITIEFYEEGIIR